MKTKFQEKHIHKFKRLKYKSGSAIFFCTLPDCHVKTNIVLALGKRNLCWRCGESFIMNEYSLRLAKPHCSNCHKTKKEINNVVIGALNERVVTGEDNYKHTSLADRLAQTIQQAQQEQDDEI